MGARLALRAAMLRRGIDCGMAERGVGDDAGRLHLTFRFRARPWIVVVEADGTLNETAAPLLGR